MFDFIKKIVDKLKLTLTIISVTVSVVAFLSTLIGVTGKHFNKSVVIKDQFTEVVELERRIALLETQLDATRAQLIKPTDLPPNTQVSVELRKLQGAFEDVNSRLAKLEHVIVTTPAKALEMPLLQRDLENVKATQQAMISTVKEGVDRVYDLNKWLLGAMSVSIISLAMASLIKGKESPNK